MTLKNTVQLLSTIFICELAGIIGSLLTMSQVSTWYSTLQKPILNPPNWLFGPVWITLYAFMGIAAFLILQHGWQKKVVKNALGIFTIQLILNTLWSIIFFGLKSPGWALINIVGLLIAIIATMISFYKISKPAMYLLVPYVLWVSFATYLNYSIWSLNPSSSFSIFTP